MRGQGRRRGEVCWLSGVEEMRKCKNILLFHFSSAASMESALPRTRRLLAYDPLLVFFWLVAGNFSEAGRRASMFRSFL